MSSRTVGPLPLLRFPVGVTSRAIIIWAPMSDPLDVVIVGGCGHVGLPLALSLADCGFSVGIDDIDAGKVAQVKSGNVPFLENGAEALLKKLLPTGRLELASDPSLLSRTDTIILVIGTPIDEFMNPSVRIFDKVLD